ncbi:MAG: PilW family protein [Gammaproteobacteria bacterium]|nr:PilW family protein [Gammaproteobacteria bacterium]
MLNRKQSSGFTLLELLVASMVGLVVIAGAYTFYSDGLRSAKRQDVRTDMVSTIQTATAALNYDLRMAGYHGGAINGRSIDRSEIESAGSGCQAWIGDPSWAIKGEVANSSGSTKCSEIAGLSLESDRLTIAYANHNPVTAGNMHNLAIYLKHTAGKGELVLGPNRTDLATEPQGTEYREFNLVMYYIREGNADRPPSLMRAKLRSDDGGNIVTDEQVIAEGIARFNVGLSTLDDCDVDGCATVAEEALDGPVFDSVKNNQMITAARYELLIQSNQELLPSDYRSNFSLMWGRTASFNDRYAYEHVKQYVDLRNF